MGGVGFVGPHRNNSMDHWLEIIDNDSPFQRVWRVRVGESRAWELSGRVGGGSGSEVRFCAN